MCGDAVEVQAIVLTSLTMPAMESQGALAFLPKAYAATERVAISPIVLSGGFINDGDLLFAGFIVFGEGGVRE